MHSKGLASSGPRYPGIYHPRGISHDSTLLPCLSNKARSWPPSVHRIRRCEANTNHLTKTHHIASCSMVMITAQSKTGGSFCLKYVLQHGPRCCICGSFQCIALAFRHSPPQGSKGLVYLPNRFCTRNRNGALTEAPIDCHLQNKWIYQTVLHAEGGGCGKDFGPHGTESMPAILNG